MPFHFKILFPVLEQPPLTVFLFHSCFLLVRRMPFFFFLRRFHQTVGHINLPSVKHTLLRLSAGYLSSLNLFSGEWEFIQVN